MPHPRRLGVFVGVLSAASTMLAVPADAEGVAEFYKDKTIAILMGTGPGGSYDLYGRTIAEHLGRHIPGHPTIIVEHMPGAGGVIAGNHIYSVAPQDGSKICSRTPCRWWRSCSRATRSVSRPGSFNGSAPTTPSRRR